MRLGWFHRHKEEEAVLYDRKRQIPVIRCSICNGEQVAGFKDRDSGAFHEVALIRSEADLAQFKKDYGLDEVRKEY